MITRDDILKANDGGKTAAATLRQFYGDKKNLTLSDMYTVSDGGDGSYSVRFDKIDLFNNKLLKASDVYDGENGGYYKGEGDEFEDPYNELETYGDDAPFGLDVEDLLNVLIQGAMK